MPLKEKLAIGSETLPPLIPIPSPAFTKIYEQGRRACEEVFRAHHPEAKFGPEAASDYVHARFQQAPILHQNISRAIFTIWNEIQRTGGLIDDEHTWRSIQKAAIWDIARAVCEKSEGAYKSSFLMEAAAGSGKLFPLAVFGEAATRLQRMNKMQGSVLFATYRKGLMGQQLWEPRRRLQQLLSVPPFGERQSVNHANEFLIYLYEKMGHKGHILFPPKIGNALFVSPAQSEEEAEQRILSALQGRTNEDGTPLTQIFESLPNAKQILQEFQGFLVGRLSVLASAGEERKWELLELPNPKERTGNTQSPFHMGRAIHQSYIDEDRVCTPEGWSMGVEPYYPGYEDPEREKRFRFIVLPITILERENARKKYERVLASVEVAILDEDFHAGNWIQEIIMQARARYPQESQAERNAPLVFGAKAAHNDDRKFHMHYTPVYGIEQYVNDKIGPPIAPVIFPHAKELHYPANTKEATQQLVDAHFSDLPFLTARKSPQAYKMRRKLFLLEEEQIELGTELLREKYKEKNIDTRVIPLSAHSPNYQDAHRFLRVLACMSDPDCGPTDIVATPRILSHSYDWQELGVVTVGAPIRKKNLLFLLERLLHSILHNSEGKGFRTLFKHQMFADSSAEHFQETLFSLLEHKFHMKREPGTYFWVPGHALLSDDMFDADKKRQGKDGHQEHPYIQWVQNRDKPPVTGKRKRVAPPEKVKQEPETVGQQKISPPKQIESHPLGRTALFSTWEDNGFNRAWAHYYAERSGVPNLANEIYSLMKRGEGNEGERLAAVRRLVANTKAGRREEIRAIKKTD
ncbi:MAG TPA: hypothetical protein VJB60_01135 [Candidatus Peribacterales bacterium]|nr:hypothetical protein [Candidatus Peribacterales bacterium]